MILSKEAILNLINNSNLITGFQSVAEQLQPAGFDLTLESVSIYCQSGTLFAGAEKADLPALKQLEFDAAHCIVLEQGVYHLLLNETVNIPNHLLARVKPRSSLLRLGANLNTAIWDPGYSGRSMVRLVVFNPYGIRLEKNCRIAQMTFEHLNSATIGYKGRYQNENS